MKGAEQDLEETAAEALLHQLIPMHARTQAVAVTEAEYLVADCDLERLDEGAHPQGFEIVVCPYIMVPLEEAYFDAGVHQVRQGCEYPDIAPGHDVSVLIPEVPYVPEKIQGTRAVGRYGL